ncbi:MAG: DEAD/DEAH box helicase, partial [Nannocystaceae bacterium]|nr:DEAD/DEAH box helicase [Nannocystaceae bacterium]
MVAGRSSSTQASLDALAGFGPGTRQWFAQHFVAPTPVQAMGWAAIAAGQHALLVAPTGSGKTLAAFLSCIDRLAHAPRVGVGVRVLYVSPLKALVYDIERNLQRPLVGLAAAAAAQGQSLVLPKVAVRTGDTTASERAAMGRHPPEILVTTPESLFLMLGSQVREHFATIETIIVDEVHALAPTKRGAHLALSLERLSAACAREPQRVGLSATARPLDEVAHFLAGARPVTIVDTGAPPDLELEIVVPVPDMTRPPPAPAPVSAGVAASPPGLAEPMANSIWPAIYPRLLEIIAQARTTLVFVNARGLCERLAQRLNEIAGAPLVRAHHGSLSHGQRAAIEAALVAGEIRGIVATSSLELGIDMGTIDRVVLVESPGAVSRGLQRVGRAGHAVGERSVARLFPKHRGDLLESTVVAARMRRGEIERMVVPRNPLDVLAQQIVAIVAVGECTVDELAALIRRAHGFSTLPDAALRGVLDMLAGRYPSHDFGELRPRLVWDRQTDRLAARRGAGRIALQNAGTIPDRGLYPVHAGEGGPRVGELDEEMVNESATGQVITLGASSWRIESIARDRVLVSPAPGESGRLPFWRGDGPGRPLELGRAIGALTRELAEREPDDARAYLAQDWALEGDAAQNLIAYVHEQRAATGVVPSDRAITIERFRDEVGDWRVCILSPLGARVHAPWALAIEAELSARAGIAVQTTWSDDGIALRLVDADELPALEFLVPDPDTVEERVVAQLAHSALFAGMFRENAGRALLLPRRRAGQRTPLWAQRLRAQQLLAVAREHPSFPIVLETYRSCLQDVFDVPALAALLRAIAAREVRVDHVHSAAASPFARGLVFAYQAAFMYEGDVPLAERRAAALALDHGLLRELLGREGMVELAELLDPADVAAVEDELQQRAPRWRARGPDELHDCLRRLGELDRDEIAARCADVDDDAPPGVEGWLATLREGHRAVTVALGGREVAIAIEDVAAYRDALGVVAPAGVPAALLEPVTDALASLLARWARTHGPFTAPELAARWGVPASQLQPAIAAACERNSLIAGPLLPGHAEALCDAEVLKRIKRRSLARLRREITAVEDEVYARFGPHWHGLDEASLAPSVLDDALARIEGLPLSWAELESWLLPARVPGFAPRQLDERGAAGELVWVGHGSLGDADGRVVLYRRDRVALLLDAPPVPDDLDPIAAAIVAHLSSRGASFAVELGRAVGADVKLAALEDALWSLVWRGLVTNDSFLPLRAHGSRSARGSSGGGRWSLVADLVGGGPSPTERAWARATTLVQRHGILCGDALAIEAIAGGMGGLLPVLRELESAGRVRRGHFVAGLRGVQFAAPGAVDRLRGMRAHDDDDVRVLSACDPALPWGAALPWPPTGLEERGGARRVAGARVVTVGGRPLLFLDRGARRWLSFAGADDAALLQRAGAALRTIAASQRGKSLRVETIDGTPARNSPLAGPLRALGFVADLRGLEL